MTDLRRLMGLFVTLSILVILAGCGGLSSEPDIIRTAALPTVTPTFPPDLGRPAARVSLTDGAAIFQGPQGCNLCHGSDGKGQGQVAQGFTCKLPDFTDPSQVRGVTVNAWFAITSNGNNGSQTCLMPPWKSRLNEQQRWDVTSYIYSLHYTPDLLAQGQQIWQSQCAACHGDRGAGDGPKAKESPRPVPNFTDPAVLIMHSDSNLWETVTHGLGPVMPAFDKTLDDNARWAVVAYLRSLTWEPAGQLAGVPVAANAGATANAAATAAATVQTTESPTILVSGKITNGTAKATVPDGLALTLRMVDLSANNVHEVQHFDAKTAADGSFSFGAVPRQNNLVYIVAAQYAGVLQTSSPVRLQPGSGATLDMPLTVYEATSDPAAIKISALRLSADPYDQNTLLVQELVTFQNTGDHVLITSRTAADGSRISVELPLPPNAQQVTLSQDSEQGFRVGSASILSVVPVAPDAPVTLQYSYLLPHTGSPEIDITVPYIVDSLTAYIPRASGFGVADPSLVPGNPVQLQTGIYDAYDLQRPLRAGETFRLGLLSPQQVAGNQQLTQGLVLALAALCILGTVAAIWRLNRRPKPAEGKPADQLVRAIAKLDDRFERGEVTQADYETQRAQLKADLSKFLGE